MKQAIFFDFDGVILESADIKTNAFLELFRDYPEYGDAIRRYHHENLGVSRYIKFEWIYRTLLNKTLDEAEKKKLGEQFSELVFNKVLACPLVAGAYQFLEEARNQYYCFVASGTPHEELQAIVSQRKLDIFFNEVCGTPHTKSNIVERLLKVYKLSSGDCWFVGDGITDYEAALETGVKFIARDTAELQQYWREKGVLKVNDLTELKAVINAYG
jgi:phosphoglycolate phosphatase-like HAD superfamily hydrolase